MLKSRQKNTALVAIAAALVSSAGCASDFDTVRATPPRASVGRELYSLVCDRVGAQALREDITGGSYHAICHPSGPVDAPVYAETVDVAQLVPLTDVAVDTSGQPVTREQQEKNRLHRIARIETMGKRREDLVRAFDAAFPDEPIALKDVSNADGPLSCNPIGDGSLQKELANTLSRFTDLYNDRTIPLVTESLAEVMNDVHASPEAQAALARLDARQGYRPGEVAMGVAQPLLSYPRLAELADALLRLIASDADPLNPDARIDPDKPAHGDNRKPIAGPASQDFQGLLAALREELRTANDPAITPPLTIALDPTVPPRTRLSRPRTNLEIARALLLAEDAAYVPAGATPKYIVRRDARGVARVPLQDGNVPSPFVDANGDKLPDLDPLGRFLTSNKAVLPTPFFASTVVGGALTSPGADGPRDADGRALNSRGGAPLYEYLDTKRTFFASLEKTLLPMVDADPAHRHETVLNVAAGLPVLFGNRDTMPVAKRSYAKDPSKGDAPVTVSYRAFHPESSPLVDLVHALGQIMSDPAIDDVLALAQRLAEENPQELARLVGVGLEIKAIADKHPEARIPANSTLWDELFDILAKMAKAPGVLEDLIGAFGKDQTLPLKDVFSAYIENKDELTYDRDALNGPAFDLTTKAITPMKVPVDRALPDTGTNRSEFQRFLQVLHETNGLAACTKDNGIAHVVWNGVSMDYPTNLLAKGACLTLTGNLPPSKLPLCGVLRIENVAAMLLDVALDRAVLDIRDPCMAELVKSPLTGIVGGTDAFLEEISGIKGFSTHPTVAGISRMVFFDTPHDGLPGDTKNMKTLNFLKDILDPIPSTVCPLAPFTDKDGKVIQLRKCASFKDTLRGRDDNATFPLEQLGFIKAVGPLAAAFADHGQPLLFVDLFDTLHVHWGSAKQTTDECDPSGGRPNNARWCSKDGAVTYEPLLVEALRTDLFATLRVIVPLLTKLTVAHCTAFDPATRACTKSVPYDGVKVLSEAVRAMVDPARNVGLKDRAGNVYATRNDGTTNPQTTPIYLLVDAIKKIDTAFAQNLAAHPEDKDRQARWRSARSQLVDGFFTVEGKGATASFQNRAVPKIMPTLIALLRAQILSHCAPGATAQGCVWAKSELANNMSETVSGPTFAGVLDLVEGIRKDDRARGELQQLLTFLLDPKSPASTSDATLAASIDMLQLLEDDTNLAPLYRAVADAAGRSEADANGHPTHRSLVDAIVETLARVFARARNDFGQELCNQEIDPQGALRKVLGHLVTPMGPPGSHEASPIEVLIDVVADVNRASPEVVPPPAEKTPSPKLAANDYANIASEVSEFCLHPSRGLEQVYQVISEATK